MAFETLLQRFPRERVLYRDALFCVVDKPAGVRAEPGVGSELCRHVDDVGLGAFEVLSSPPPRASGAALLAVPGASRASAQRERAPLTVVVAVEGHELGASAHWAVRDGEGEQRVSQRVLRRRGQRALVELRSVLSPERIIEELARRRQPIVGDHGRGGPAATRSMLHVSAVGDLPALAPLPVEFDSWLEGVAHPPPTDFEAALRRAAIARVELWPTYEAYRLIGEESGEVRGLSVDRYGDFAVLSISTDEAWHERQRIADCLMDHGARGVYVKRRLRADLRGVDAEALAPPVPIAGSPAPERFEVRAGSFRAWVQLGDGHATGLFLDQRASWERVGQAARGRALLNLFCYTAPFTVAAAAAGAVATTSVDLSRRALGRARANLELNGLGGPAHRLLDADVLDWLRRAARKPQRYGWIVLDPPSFGTRSRGKVLRTDRDYGQLVLGAAELLESGGHLLCVSHHKKLPLTELLRTVREACAARGRSVEVEPWVGSWDAQTLPGVTATQSVLARVR